MKFKTAEPLFPNHQQPTPARKKKRKTNQKVKAFSFSAKDLKHNADRNTSYIPELYREKTKVYAAIETHPSRRQGRLFHDSS